MKKDEVDIILEMSQSYFKESGWSEIDIKLGQSWLAATIYTLGISNFPAPLPVLDKKYPEVLRALANILEVIIERNK